MAKISKIGDLCGVLLLCIAIFLGGCTASMQARSKFDLAEQLVAEEKFDEAIEKYKEAIELEPGSKAYKLKLLAAQTRAASEHARQARLQAKQGNFDKALDEYLQARKYNTGTDYIDREIVELQEMIEAEKFAEEGAKFYEKGDILSARKAIERALKLDTHNARALAIKDLIGRSKSITVMDGVVLDMASDEPFTLSFNNTKIKEVFSVITKLSGINFIFDEKVRDDKIFLYHEKATFAQAMELILQMNGLEKKVLNSRTIIIYPATRDKEKQYDDQVIQTFYLSNIEAKKAVNLLRSMLQLRKVYVHEERNALVVRDKPEIIKLAEQILTAADRENSEVVLALELVSVADSDTLDIGTNLSTYSIGVGVSQDGQNLVSSGIPSSGSVGNMITSLNGLDAYFTLPSAVFEFAKTLKSTNILANPKIRVRNKEKAKVHVGTREPIVTTTTTDISTSSNIQYIDVGIKLDVEPTIQLDNTVETKLKLEVSQVIGRETVGSPTAPVTALTISTTNAETVLTLKDGEQTIIGGLFEQLDTSQKNTIPFIGEIPGLGALFSGYSNTDDKREILLSITPYIVKRVDVPDAEVATIWSGGEDNLKLGPNFGAFVQPLKSEVEAFAPQPVPAKGSPKAQKAVFETRSGKTIPPDDNGTSEPLEEKSPGTDLEPQSGAEPPGPVKISNEEQEPREEAVPTEVMEGQEAKSAANNPAILFVGPREVEKGKNFILDVQVENVEQLFNASLYFKYDPKALKITRIIEGGILRKDSVAKFSSWPDYKTDGQVIIDYKQVEGGKGVSGQGSLFRLYVEPLSTGSTQLELNRLNFRTPDGSRIKVLPQAIKLEVR